MTRGNVPPLLPHDVAEKPSDPNTEPGAQLPILRQDHGHLRRPRFVVHGRAAQKQETQQNKGQPFSGFQTYEYGRDQGKEGSSGWRETPPERQGDGDGDGDVQEEPLDESGRRPGDIWVQDLTGEGQAALDMAITNGMGKDSLEIPAGQKGARLRSYEDYKRNYKGAKNMSDKTTDTLCREGGLLFVPMVFEAHGGGFGFAMREELGQLAEGIANRWNRRPEAVARRIAQRVLPNTLGERACGFGQDECRFSDRPGDAFSTLIDRARLRLSSLLVGLSVVLVWHLAHPRLGPASLRFHSILFGFKGTPTWTLPPGIIVPGT